METAAITAITGDGNVELWLSFDEQENNKMLIAYHTGSTRSEQWNRYSTQKSNLIFLVKGESCYIEALMKHNTGNYNMAVEWLRPGETGITPSEIIPGLVLSPLMLPDITKNAHLAFSEESGVSDSLVFSVYPNPSSGRINISASSRPSEPVDISIISPLGEIIFKKRIYLENNFFIDMEGLVSGYCIVQIKSGEYLVHKKLLIMRE